MERREIVIEHIGMQKQEYKCPNEKCNGGSKQHMIHERFPIPKFKQDEGSSVQNGGTPATHADAFGLRIDVTKGYNYGKGEICGRQMP
jgi:hypothetical protein